jgi:hypothetical protein
MDVVKGARAVAVPIVEFAFAAGGDITNDMRVLAGTGGDLGQIPVALGQETGPAERER